MSAAADTDPSSWAVRVLARAQATELWGAVAAADASGSAAEPLLLLAQRGEQLARSAAQWERDGGAGTLAPGGGAAGAPPLAMSALRERFAAVAQRRRQQLAGAAVARAEAQQRAAEAREAAAHVAARAAAAAREEERRLLLLRRRTQAAQARAAGVADEPDAAALLAATNKELREGMLGLLQQVAADNALLDRTARAAERNVDAAAAVNAQLARELADPTCSLLVRLALMACAVFCGSYFVIKLVPRPPRRGLLDGGGIVSTAASAASTLLYAPAPIFSALSSLAFGDGSGGRGGSGGSGRTFDRTAALGAVEATAPAIAPNWPLPPSPESPAPEPLAPEPTPMARGSSEEETGEEAPPSLEEAVVDASGDRAMSEAEAER